MDAKILEDMPCAVCRKYSAVLFFSVIKEGGCNNNKLCGTEIFPNPECQVCTHVHNVSDQSGQPIHASSIPIVYINQYVMADCRYIHT